MKSSEFSIRDDLGCAQTGVTGGYNVLKNVTLPCQRHDTRDVRTALSFQRNDVKNETDSPKSLQVEKRNRKSSLCEDVSGSNTSIFLSSKQCYGSKILDSDERNLYLKDERNCYNFQYKTDVESVRKRIYVSPKNFLFKHLVNKNSLECYSSGSVTNFFHLNDAAEECTCFCDGSVKNTDVKSDVTNRRHDVKYLTSVSDKRRLLSNTSRAGRWVVYHIYLTLLFILTTSMGVW